MTTPVIQRIADHRELISAVDGEPFVRYEIGAGLAGPAWVLGRSAVIFRPTHTGLSGLAAIGETDALVRLFGELGAAATDGLQSLTATRAALPALAAVLPPLHPGGEWDWMWTTVAPAQLPGEDQLVRLDDTADAEELRALNELGNPTAESKPGTGRSELWLGIRDRGGAIVAAGSLHRTPAGAPHLTGIVTSPDHRGRGYGAAVTAGLTRASLTMPGRVTGVSTLGMYAGNDVARRIYHRLGYRTAQQFSSRRFTAG